MSNTWINHKNTEILYTVFANQNEDQMIETIKEQAEIVKSRTGKVLILDDFRDSFTGKKFMRHVNELTKSIYNEKNIKGAILGISGIKKILLNAFNLVAKSKIVPFDTKEEAMDFLVTE